MLLRHPRPWLLTLIMLCTACGVAQPAAQPAPTAAPQTPRAEATTGVSQTVEDRRRVGVLTKALSNEFFLIMKQGYEAAGEKYGVEVIVRPAAAEDDIEGQRAALEALIDEGIDALAVTPLTSDNLTPALVAASEHSVPIINVDELIPDDVARAAGFTITSRIASDNGDAGAQAAKYMIANLPAGSAVAVIEGKPGVTSGTQRRDGFITAAEAGGLRLVASTHADWDRALARDAVADILKRHPEVKGIYFCNDTMALGGLAAVEEANLGATLILIGTDAIPEAMQAVKEGRLTGTVAQFPYELGMLAVETAVKVLDGRPVPGQVPSPVKLMLQNDR
jgi:ABC-type sugar transport system substrate-binding protein